MRKLLMLLALLLMGSRMQVQAQKVLYSDYTSFDFRNSIFSVVGKVDGTLYAFHSYNNEYFLEAYDNGMNRIATVVLDFFPTKIMKVKFYPLEKQIIVLYESMKGTKISQYAALLDEKGRLLKSPLKVGEVKTGFWGSANHNYFSSVISADKKQLVIYGAEAKGKKLEVTNFWIDIQQMKIARRNKVVYKAGDIVTHGDALLTNEGVFYLPVYTQVGSRDFSDEYQLLAMKQGENTYATIKLPLNEAYMEYPYQKLDNINNKIYIGSFYSLRKNGNNEGVLYAVYDINTGAFQSNKLISFDDRLRSATGSRNKQRALNDFKINHLIVKNDGGFAIAAEESYVNLRTNYTPGWGFYSFYYTPMVSQSVREFYFNDILVLSYNQNGETEWSTFVRKEQYSQEDGGLFSSYAMLNSGGGLAFLFNDFNARRSRIQLAAVEATGQVTTNFLDAGSDDDPDWLPRSGRQVDVNEIVIPCLRKRQICFAKIVL